MTAISNANYIDESNRAILNSPLSLASSEGISTPRLEVSEIDAVPFSEDFNELFEGLGLHAQKSLLREDSPDFSYSIENFTNLKDISPEWEHDEIDEIVVMSSRRPCSSMLPTIRETGNESVAAVPPAALSEYSFEPLSSRDLDEQLAVFRPCVRRDTGVSYVMKVSKAFTVAASRERAILETMAELEVQFVAQARWIFQEAELLYIVNENHPRGNLFEYMKQHGNLGSIRTTFYASELVVALSSLHSAGIVHRALNPSTFLFDAQGHLVLCDFTYAELVSSTESSSTTAHNWIQYPHMPPEYLAPELILGWAHDVAVDCWSFGMMLCFMLTGGHPFSKPEQSPSMIYDQLLRSPLSSESLRLIDSDAKDLILQCLERNPSVRPSMEDIREHLYFNLVDWEKVSSKRLAVPSFATTSSVRSPHSTTIAQNSHMSFTSSTPEPQRRQSISSVNDLGVPDIPVSPNAEENPENPIRTARQSLIKPSGRIGVPSVVHEEDEPPSDDELSTQCRSGSETARADRIAQFWDNIDREERSSVRSTVSQEFGVLGSGVQAKPPKLRKHRSSIHPRHRLFNISTSSLQIKLRKKPRSTSALREPQPRVIPKEVEKIENLPMGIHQVGSGIGFTYNLPSQAPSKLSVCSFAPPCGTGLFSVKGFGRGFGHSSTTSRRAKESKMNIRESESDDEPVIDIAPPTSTIIGDADLPARDREPCPPQPGRDVGNNTFLRDMYHTPSWLLSPPDSISSPIAPILNTTQAPSSPQSDLEPLTPATLVEIDMLGGQSESQVKSDVNDLTVCMSKGLLSLSGDGFGELDPTLSPDSTLRLVPPSRSALRLSFISMGDGDEFVF